MTTENVTVKDLVITSIVSILFSFPFGYLSYIIYAFFSNLLVFIIPLYISFYLGSYVVLWSIILWIYLVKNNKKPNIFKYLTFMVSLVVLVVAIHSGILKDRIEQVRTPTFFDNQGFFIMDSPILSNDTYIMNCSFSFKNTDKEKYGRLEFSIKFNNWNTEYYVLECYPNKSRKMNLDYMPDGIYFKCREIKPDETAYLIFVVSWNKKYGDETFMPIDFSSSGTSLKINGGAPISYVYNYS